MKAEEEAIRERGDVVFPLSSRALYKAQSVQRVKQVLSKVRSQGISVSFTPLSTH